MRSQVRVHRRAVPRNNLAAGPDERCYRRVGEWVDVQLGHPVARKLLLDGRQHFREVYGRFERDLNQYKKQCERAALRVVENGLLSEEHAGEGSDPRGAIDVAGWVERGVGPTFRRAGWLDRTGRGSYIRREPKNAADVRATAEAAAQILRDPSMQDLALNLDANGTHFWARIRVNCVLPSKPRSPTSKRGVAQLSPEDRLAYACAALLAIRDAVCDFPFEPEQRPVKRDGRWLFGADLLHHALRPYVVTPEGRRWHRDGRHAEELQRLVAAEIERRRLDPAYGRTAIKLTPKEQRVWETISATPQRSAQIARVVATNEVYVRRCIGAVRQKKGDVDCIREIKGGFIRPDLLPSAS